MSELNRINWPPAFALPDDSFGGKRQAPYGGNRCLEHLWRRWLLIEASPGPERNAVFKAAARHWEPLREEKL